MRRIFAILLVCLLPLQSFAGLVMSEKMASMNPSMSQTQVANSLQTPCHEASQPMQAADQDCCGSQVMCHSLCQMATVLPTGSQFLSAFALIFLPSRFVLTFQSADPHAGFKPPIL